VLVYVIAVDYDRYAILNSCLFPNTKRKSMPFNILHVLQIDCNMWLQVTMVRRVFIFRMEERSQVRWVAANMLNKHSWTTNKCWPSSLGLGEVLTIPQTKNEFCCETVNG